MTVSPALQRLYASAPIDGEIRETLEISHPLFLSTHYITSAAAGFSAKLETGATVDFVALPFAAKQPNSDGSGQQDLGVVIDNVDREIIDELERAAVDPSTRIRLVYRAYSASDLTGPGADPIELSISEVAAGLTTVQATAGRADVLNKKFPAVLYSIQQFPGLDR